MIWLGCTKKYAISCPAAKEIPAEYKKSSKEVVPELKHPVSVSKDKPNSFTVHVDDFQALLQGLNECEHIRLGLLKYLEVGK